MLGKLFGISQPKANLWIHYLLPILSLALSKMEVMPCRNMQDLQEKEASTYSHDGTERPIQRPKDNEKQKKYYSGKKKIHTVKNNILANSNCEVIFLTPTEEGKKHDKKIADDTDCRKGANCCRTQVFKVFLFQMLKFYSQQKNRGGKS